jgi:Lrp/AsnC family transcriptional regulator, leucine-responsive regulatory protein
MDTTDLAILRAIEEDAHRTYADIGAQVGLAASSVHDRVRKLERAKVIRGYKADVDYEKAGWPIAAFVSLALRPESPSNIPSRIAEFPLVQSCYSVAGDNSYVLVVRAPHTRALEELLDGLRGKLEVTTRSVIVLSTPFELRPMVSRRAD